MVSVMNREKELRGKMSICRNIVAFFLEWSWIYEKRWPYFHAGGHILLQPTHETDPFPHPTHLTMKMAPGTSEMSVLAYKLYDITNHAINNHLPENCVS
jgi:hypothetical protein